MRRSHLQRARDLATIASDLGVRSVHADLFVGPPAETECSAKNADGTQCMNRAPVGFEPLCTEHEATS